MWTQSTSVTDRRTDGQTDGRTDRITITKTVQTASHGKHAFVGILLLFSSSSSKGLASFASSSLLIGFSGLSTDGYVTGLPVDHVTNMAAGWRQLLQRYVDARFRLQAADKIFDVVAHNYDRWDEKSGAFLTSRSEANETGEVKGQQVGGDRASERQKSRDIAGDFLADSQIAAPTIRMAKYHARCSQGRRRRQRSGSTYLYYFNDTGVGHDLLTYVFGAPLSPGIDPFHSGAYTDTDRQMAVDVIKHWTNFMYSG